VLVVQGDMKGRSPPSAPPAPPAPPVPDALLELAAPPVPALLVVPPVPVELAVALPVAAVLVAPVAAVVAVAFAAPPWPPDVHAHAPYCPSAPHFSKPCAPPTHVQATLSPG